MASSLGSAFRSFWHTMTSYDRHSSYDSPFRSGRHVPLNDGDRMGGLTSVATASESRHDLSSPYMDDSSRSTFGMDARSSTAYMGGGGSVPPSPNPTRSYSPGMRSINAKRASTTDGFELQSPTGEIPMQSFQDGLPPPPPVAHSWRRIDTWAEENYPELYDQLCEGCTVNDLNELEHQLDCSLPIEVRESLQAHDGQERGGNPTGIIFSSMLLDCEEIVQEWDQWRQVNQQFLLDTTVIKPQMPTKAFGGSSEASSSKAGPAPPASPANPTWRQDLMNKQDSVPAGAVQRAYAHPGWIPLVRDWGGNNLAVDLAPGPKGTWGQIILFGRDYDTKYVVARSWAAFVAIVADDLNSGKWFVDEETMELKLREFKQARVEPAYFEILRWRMDQKYGRRQAKRKSAAPGTVSPSGSASPYASPAEPNGETRGRSMQRFKGASPLASPMRPGYGGSSPLARVTEEHTGSDRASLNGVVPEKLVEVDTPRGSVDVKSPTPSSRLSQTEATEQQPLTNGSASSPPSSKRNSKDPVVLEEPMKTIEI